MNYVLQQMFGLLVSISCCTVIGMERPVWDKEQVKREIECIFTSKGKKGNGFSKERPSLSSIVLTFCRSDHNALNHSIACTEDADLIPWAISKKTRKDELVELYLKSGVCLPVFIECVTDFYSSSQPEGQSALQLASGYASNTASRHEKQDPFVVAWGYGNGPVCRVLLQKGYGSDLLYSIGERNNCGIKNIRRDAPYAVDVYQDLRQFKFQSVRGRLFGIIYLWRNGISADVAEYTMKYLNDLSIVDGAQTIVNLKSTIPALPAPVFPDLK